MESSLEAGAGYTAATQNALAGDQAYLKSKGVVIVDFDTSPWHERIGKLAQKLEAKGMWSKGLLAKLLALGK